MSAKKLSYDLLYLFREVMRCGSFQKAAKESGSTAASIRKKISQLETELNIQLFESDSDAMVPTAAGLYLYDRLDSVLWNLEATLQQAKNIPAESTMKLNIGIYNNISGSFYGEMIRKFSENHPDIKFSLSSPSTSELRRRLLDGRMDIAVLFSVGLSDEPRLSRKSLFQAKPCIYYNTCMNIGDGKKISIDSFRERPFVCLDTDVAAMNMLRALPFEPQKVYFAENLKALLLYVNAGLACTILGPAQQFKDIADMGFFELADADYTMGIDLVWEKSNPNPAIGLLVDTACTLFQAAK